MTFNSRTYHHKVWFENVSFCANLFDSLQSLCHSLEGLACILSASSSCRPQLWFQQQGCCLQGRSQYLRQVHVQSCRGHITFSSKTYYHKFRFENVSFFESVWLFGSLFVTVWRTWLASSPLVDNNWGSRGKGAAFRGGISIEDKYMYM